MSSEEATIAHLYCALLECNLQDLKSIYTRLSSLFPDLIEFAECTSDLDDYIFADLSKPALHRLNLAFKNIQELTNALRKLEKDGSQ